MSKIIIPEQRENAKVIAAIKFSRRARSSSPMQPQLALNIVAGSVSSIPGMSAEHIRSWNFRRVWAAFNSTTMNAGPGFLPNFPCCQMSLSLEQQAFWRRALSLFLLSYMITRKGDGREKAVGWDLIKLLIIFGTFGQQCDGCGVNMQGWIRTPEGRISSFVSLRSPRNEHVCSGILIDEFHVLTAAHCIKASTENARMIVGTQNGAKNRRVHAHQVEKLRAESCFKHPAYTGNPEDGYDIALLRLPQPVGITASPLADPMADLYPGLEVQVLQFDEGLKSSRFTVVRNDLCPHLKGLGSSTFCAFSREVTPQSGCSGGPALIADWRFDGPKEDLIVGIISYANFSALEDSGVAFVKISKVRPWIDEIRRYQVPKVLEVDVSESLPFHGGSVGSIKDSVQGCIQRMWKAMFAARVLFRSPKFPNLVENPLLFVLIASLMGNIATLWWFVHHL